MKSKVIVTFRGTKVEIPLQLPATDDDNDELSSSSSSSSSSPLSGLTVGQVRSRIVEEVGGSSSLLEPHDITLIFKGQKLVDDTQDLVDILRRDGIGKAPALSSSKNNMKNKAKTYRLMATGVSQTESRRADEEYQEHQQKNKILVRDDLSAQGKQKERARQQLGRNMLSQARNNTAASSIIGGIRSSNNHGFGRIETLPNLPNQNQARQIMTTLANDPGILACMAKHQWNVGSLAELFPDGKVGQSKVCVMGLNKNKGQQILLRIRTDDLKGFRKMASIREVLYHELAHNVHSEHDSNFFQLMRQIKKECLELDWTDGEGTSSSMMETDDYQESAMNPFNGQKITGGSYVLGGDTTQASGAPARELAARAALMRLSDEEEDVRQNCGCGHEHAALFLPLNNQNEIDEFS